MARSRPDAVVYWIDRGDGIARVNAAWTRFAIENDAPELDGAHVVGRHLFDFLGDSTTKHLYEGLLARVRGGRTARFPLRCDSPALRRHLEMVVSREADGTVRFETIVLAVEPRAPQPLWQRGAPRGNQLLRVCSWCKRLDVDGAWLEVEDAVPRLGLFDEAPPPFLTHGICPTCAVQMQRAIDASTD